MGTPWWEMGVLALGALKASPGPPPSPSHKALLCLVTSWSLEVRLPRGPS